MSNLLVQVGNSKVFSLPEQHQAVNAVVQQFSSCRVAKKLLDKISSLIHLTLRIDHVDTYSVEFPDSTQAIITIPSETVQDPNLSLAFELTTANNHYSFDNVTRAAEEGNIGMEKYATLIGGIQAQSQLVRQSLKKHCKKAWNLQLPNPTPTSIDARLTDVKSILWNADWTCNTDHNRKQWVELYQKKYCQAHSEDKKSCEAKAGSFCYSEYAKTPPEKKGAFLVQRLCDKFYASAPETVKPALVDKVRKACPNVLKAAKTDL